MSEQNQGKCPLCNQPMDPKSGDKEYSGLENNSDESKKKAASDSLNKAFGS